MICSGQRPGVRAMVGLAVVGVVAASPLVADERNDPSGLPIVSQTISVSDAVEIALKNNPTVASRRAMLAAAAARVGMARAMARPQVSVSAFGTAGNMPMVLAGPPSVEPQNFSITSDNPRIDGNLMAMYPLYTGGSLKGRVGSAQAQHDASSYDVAATELDTALAVKTAYYQVLLARRFVDAYQKRVNESQERVRIAEEAFFVGQVARFDLLRNQTDLAEAQQQLNNAQRDAEMALIDLRNTMGVSQTSQLTLTQDLTSQPAPAGLDALQAAALRQRPELQAARSRVLSAQASVAVARSSYRPQVYATAMADLSATQDDSMDSGADTGYLIGVTAALPILDGGLRRSSVDESRAMLAQMQADERGVRLSISRDVAGAYAQSTAAAKNAVLAQASVTQAEEDYRVIRMRYEAGKATNVEVLDALASLTRARTLHAQALYEQQVATDTLSRAVGRR